jgi:hypothetical protein
MNSQKPRFLRTSPHYHRAPARATGGLIALVVVALGCPLQAQQVGIQPTRPQPQAAATVAEVQQLRELVLALQAEVARLRDEVKAPRTSAVPAAAPLPDSAPQATAPAQAPANAVHRKSLDSLLGADFNFYLDGYYSYNFNRPVGNVNLLRAYDVTSRSFNINQTGLVIEHAPDVSAGRRWGLRLDLMYGQATESLQGSPQNEPRPWVFRPLFQAYGSYVVPVGSNLKVDFGKWASALGYENNYTKDQLNYSRSYFFSFLPAYHTGVRASYDVNDRLSLGYWRVNGANQTENFNSFDSQALAVSAKPNKNVAWSLNYYVGREQRSAEPVPQSALPALPTQPGLSVAPVLPAPRGRLHILDTYAAWNAGAKLLLAGEADYVVNRVRENSPPAHVAGGAAYARYQFTPRFFLASRFEYLDDAGGMFSGKTEALKEWTLTGTYALVEGFQSRLEFRHDFSNQPLFLTRAAGVLKKNQNTLTFGLIWWLGGKQGAW